MSKISEPLPAEFQVKRTARTALPPAPAPNSSSPNISKAAFVVRRLNTGPVAKEMKDSHLALDVLLQQTLLDRVHLDPVTVVVVIHHISAELMRNRGTVQVGLPVTLGVIIATWRGERQRETDREIKLNLKINLKNLQN